LNQVSSTKDEAKPDNAQQTTLQREADNPTTITTTRTITTPKRIPLTHSFAPSIPSGTSNRVLKLLMSNKITRADGICKPSKNIFANEKKLKENLNFLQKLRPDENVGRKI
jgi:hypothetical protein